MSADEDIVRKLLSSVTSRGNLGLLAMETSNFIELRALSPSRHAQPLSNLNSKIVGKLVLAAKFLTQVSDEI
jgi:hypothetical protein